MFSNNLVQRVPIPDEQNCISVLIMWSAKRSLEAWRRIGSGTRRSLELIRADVNRTGPGFAGDVDGRDASGQSTGGRACVDGGTPRFEVIVAAYRAGVIYK